MSAQFFSDECRNHRPVHLLHDLSRGTAFVSHFTNLPYYLLNPCRRTYIIGGFLEGRRLRDEPSPFGEKRNEAAVYVIDALADFVQRGAKYIHFLDFLIISLRLIEAGS